jgi:hypothetical protein
VVLQFGLAELLEHQLLLCRAGSFCCNNYHWCWKCQSTYLDFCPAEFDPTIYAWVDDRSLNPCTVESFPSTNNILFERVIHYGGWISPMLYTCLCLLLTL